MVAGRQSQRRLTSRRVSEPLSIKSWDLGIQVGYAWRDYDHNLGMPTVYKFGSRDVSLGLYSQKYFPLSDKFYFALTGGLTYGFGRSREKSFNADLNQMSETTYKNSVLTTSMSPALLFFPSKNWALQLNVGSVSYVYSDGEYQPFRRFDADYGAVRLGMAYYLRKK